MRAQVATPEPTVENIAHLIRRAGFGAGRAELEQAAAAGIPATVDALLAAPTDPPPGVERPELTPPSKLQLPEAGASEDDRRRQQRRLLTAGRAEYAAVVAWWVDVMVATPTPQVEKLVFVWHDHFATGIRKVKSAWAMLNQQDTIRRHALGAFPDLVSALARDPAMIRWLDLGRSGADAPNENFARELMELFTLGAGNYSQEDVREAARALTGWTFDRFTDSALFRPGRHDFGTKTILGETGRFGTDDVVRLVTSGRESARHVARALWSAYAHPNPPEPLVEQLAGVYEASGRRTDALLRAMFTHPDFYTADARTGLVKTPVELVAGALRAFGIRIDRSGDHPQRLVEALGALGQAPFDPPNVGGWPQNSYWATTAMTQARFQVAGAIAALVPDSLLPVPGSAQSVQDMLDRLGMLEVPPQLVPRLQEFRGSPRDLVRLVLASPPYQRN